VIFGRQFKSTLSAMILTTKRLDILTLGSCGARSIIPEEQLPR
jgi:hypothetical protein